MPSRPFRPADPPAASARASERPGERIAKLLARAGIASRREIERMIAEGRIARDGVAIDTPATVLTSLHGITVDGVAVAAPAPARLFAYHKPPGLLVTERDPKGRPTIYDRLPAGLPRVMPVGRLDVGTEGLLLLTTDGEFKRQLELPATGVERTYRARAYGPISQASLEELIHGVEIDGVRYGQIDANLERRTGANTWIELTLTEGKNREVRRVLEHLGLEVNRLIRTRYGPFVLADMPPGAVGEVRQHDLVAFRQSLKGGKGGDKDMRVMALPLPEVAPEADMTAPPKPKRSSPPQARLGEGDGRVGLAPAIQGRARGTTGPAIPPQADGGAAGGDRRGARKSLHPRAARGGPQARVDHAPRGQGSSGGRSDPNLRARSARTKKEEVARPAKTVVSTKRQRLTANAEHPHPSGATRLPPSPTGRGKGPARRQPDGKGEGEQAGSRDMNTPRPPRPQRKPGWARPKPRSGPGRPTK